MNSNCKSVIRNILLVFNSEAGKGNACAKRVAILKNFDKYGCRYEAITTDELEGMKDCLASYDTVVAAGGDGTVLKVISFLANTDMRLGIIPCGTANLFAASLCIPFNIAKAVDVIVQGTTRKVDIGKAGDEYFALRVGFGYDADIVNGAKRYLKRKFGYFAYLLQGIIGCFRLSQKSYKVTIDDKSFIVDANSIIVANAGNLFRNLFTVAPLGSVNDGKLDIFILLTRNLWEFLDIFVQIIRGRHKISDKVIYGQATNIKVESLGNSFKNIHMDGEPCAKLKLDISVVPGALKVMVPST